MRRSNQKQPEHKELKYKFNSDTRYYEQTNAPLSFNKMPFDLKVEPTQRKDIIKSKHVILGRIKNGKYKFFTGLIPTGYKNQYFGDHYEYVKRKKKNSFIIFQFSENKRELTIYFFNHFTLYPKKRLKFITDFMISLNKKREATTPPLNVQTKTNGKPFGIDNKDTKK
ncbi:MAG: hypothetical protein L3J35_09380 [Bacteroidales bacterium]|nr:hypothetical protein [Bacteroidales bacterium]